IPINIRLICATNVPITDLANETRFRKDLLYRINTVDITIPPLRDRGTDLLLLSKYFINFYSEKYGKDNFLFTPEFTQKIKQHPFNGNVRELQYALERAVIMADSATLQASDLTFSTFEQRSVE